MTWQKYKVDIPEGKCGDWSVEKFEIPEFSIEGMRLAFAGRGVEPGTYTKLLHGRCLVMSDTHAEIRDCMPLFWAAKGKGVVNGLGLGMCLRGVLLKPEVTHVTVIEKSSDVIELVGKYFVNDERVTIINADATTYKPKGLFDFAWHDIWNDICGDNYHEMKRLHRKYGRVAAWQSSWCRYETLDLANKKD